MNEKKKDPGPWPSGSVWGADPDGRAGERRWDKLPSSDDPSEDGEFGDLVCAIRRMPDKGPPADFTSSVMVAVRVKKRPWWYRLYRCARSPRSFTYTPLRLAPAAFVLMLACLLSTMLYTREDNRRLAQTQPRDRIRVVLNLPMPEARNVQVMGTFNGWRPQKCELREAGKEATWSATLLVPPGRYEYVFLVDGAKIVSDPQGDLLQDDGFGNVNNVLVVGNSHEQSI